MAPDLTKLTQPRGIVKAQLTRFEKFVENLDDSTDCAELQLRLSKAEELLSKFETIQDEIESLDSSATQLKEREAFENAYFRAIATAKTHLVNRNRDSNPPAVTLSSSDPQSVSNVKLPTINLPVFDGAYDHWLQFHDTFDSLIHNNASLSEIQKLHYLRASLKGEAARVVEALVVSASSYHVAWNLLRDRFENKKLIMNHHVKALFNLNTVHKESATALRELSDSAQTHLRALSSLGQPVQYWDTLVIHILSSKLDSATRREWECKMAPISSPSTKNMTDFLATRCQLLEILQSERSISRTNQSFDKGNSRRERSTNCLVAQKLSCPICKQAYPLYACKVFLQLSTQQRISETKRHKLCINCLRPGHFAEHCQSGSCRKCDQKHNTVLHQGVINSPLGDNTGSSSTPTSSIVTHCISEPQVLLSTAVVHIVDASGKYHECRLLLDSGSQSNFITKEACKRFNLQTNATNVQVSGISSHVTRVLGKTTVHLRSRCSGFETDLNCLVLPKITDNLPTAFINRRQIPIPANIQLADPLFHRQHKVDMLIGAGNFWDLFCVGQIRLGKGHPLLQKTKLGWVLSGSLFGHLQQKTSTCNLSIQQLEKQVERFWEVEGFESQERMLSHQEQFCEQHFLDTHSLDTDGHFVVRLPLSSGPEILGESRERALNRFYQMERRLERAPETKKLYRAFMAEYLALGHAKEIPVSEREPKGSYYLPHHAVLKVDSLTTKLRVVFDASAKTDNGNSLNDIMMVGPVVQQDLLSIILRFRSHKYVLTADVEKMYRQVRMHEDDQNLQRILWRSSTSEPVRCFRLTTVTYGTAAASFLATRCLLEIANKEESNFPLAKTVIKRDFYIDDLITGADDLETAQEIRMQTDIALQQYGFPLRKWCANDKGLLPLDSCTSDDMQVIDLNKGEFIKTLGLGWSPVTDTLQYRVSVPQDVKDTKRGILSTIARIFDPLGLLGPVTVTAKIVLQRVWQQKLHWDESLPLELHTAWERCRGQLSSLNELRVQRHVIGVEAATHLQIHGFSDASESAYGAAIYIRAFDEVGAVSCLLLCARSRVAPLKQVSLPRLELCGALLLAELYEKVVRSLEVEAEVFFWTDSTIVLAWLDAPPNQWQTFIANRVAKIQRIAPSPTWRHIRSNENPADLLTRGLLASQLVELPLWWSGPPLLQGMDRYWPARDSRENIDVPERRKERALVASVATANHTDELFERYSSLNRLNRVIAYSLRFVRNTTASKVDRSIGPLTVQELRNALRVLIRLAQGECFGSEIMSLETDGVLPTRSKLLTLRPLLDKNKLLRVGGRLEHAPTTYDQRHPIILPPDHHMTKLIVIHEHLISLHSGIQATLASLRMKYWPLRGRSTVKRYTRSCLICFKNRPTSYQPLMGALPIDRVSPSRPFQSTGVDYAGPVHVKIGSARSRLTIKGYIAVFVCFSTKAIHLELVGALTTAAFIAVLRRFTARRGRAAHIHSDSGTNFVGANRKLRELTQQFASTEFRDQVCDALSTEGTQWHFIPSRSPHFGGLWEAGVKSVKHHLRRIVGGSPLNFEEIYTVLTQIEACLNSRPLCPLSQNPTDLSPLTPGHFLIGQPLTAVPDADLESVPTQRLDRWQHVQLLVQQFWRRWVREYLSQLQRRPKWHEQGVPALKVGTMVLLKDESRPSLSWKLGRVTKVHLCPDGVIRVATVRVSTGAVTRSVTKLCALPNQE